MELRFKRAVREDAETLIRIYNGAFYADFIRYGECPAYGRSRERMEESIAGYPKLIAYAGEEAAGVISWEDRGEGAYYVGCLAVLPKWQGQGVGSALFRRLLAECGSWKSVELITPADKAENVAFYTRRCGMTAGERSMDGSVEVVRLFRERVK